MGYDGSITFDTSLDTSGFAEGTSDITKKFQAVRKGAEAAADGMAQLPDKLNQTANSTSRLADIVKGGGVFKLIEKGVAAIANSLDSAIDRYDIMNRFPMMMEQMGYGADTAQAAVQRLSDGIQGIPTTLDSVVSTAQRLTVLTGNLDNATDTTLALNNAFLASGSGAEGASRGLEQYVQMLSKGKVDLESWRTLQETMGLALNKVAESFGYVGESAQNDLYGALQAGEITFSQFNSRLIQLNDGVGGFADLAKTASVGIKTAWTNMGTAIVRGTTSIVEAIDSGLSYTRFNSIQTVIQGFGKGIENAMKAAVPAIELVASHADTLAGVLGLLTAAYAANTAAAALNKAMHGGLGQVLGSVSILYGVLTTQGGAMVVVQGLLTTATTALSTSFGVLLGPVGLTVVALGAVAAGAVALYNWITADSAAYTEQAKILDGLTDQQKSFAKSEESNAKAAQDSLKAVRANADAAGELAKELGGLSSIENKSVSQKQRMAAMVEQLNDKYADLCLTYDEEADKLSMNAEQLKAYIAAQQTMEEAAVRQERYNDLLEEEAAIRQNTAELENLQRAYAAQLEQKIISQSEYNDLMQQSGDMLVTYAAQEKELADQRSVISQELAALDTATAQTVIDNAQAQQEATRAAAEAEEAEMQRRKDALQSYTDAATDMYDRINTKSELSVNEMIANLQANQEAVATWADSLVALGERGLDQGLLQQLRDAGPESAATVAELVTATDEQLATLSETFRAGGQTAVNALQTELGLPEVANAGSEMVDNMAASVTANSALTDAVTQSVTEARESARAEAASGGFRQIGQQMIQGITAGVVAGQAGLIEAMRSAVQEAVTAAKTEADINSPSRLFRRVIGLNIMRGWSLGVQDGEPLVTASIVDAMSALRKEVRSGANPANWVTAMRDTVAYTQAHAAVPAAPMMNWRTPAYAAASPTTIYQTNSFSTHDSLSESELTREAEDMAQRLRWMIP